VLAGTIVLLPREAVAPRAARCPGTPRHWRSTRWPD